MNGAAPPPVGGDGQLRGTRRRQRGASQIAPIVKELIMRFIPETEAEALRAHLDKKLERPVTLNLFIEPKSAIVVPGRPGCELREETRALLEDVASLSDQITLKVHDVRTESELAREMGVSHVPTLVLRGAARGVVRYLGIPAGLEFGTLLEDLTAVSRGTTTLGNDSRTKLAMLSKPVHVQVFVTPTCPYCPKVASLAHQAAVESAHVIGDVVEISEFPDLAAQYRVRGVPKIVMNDSVELVGAQPEAAFLEAMLKAAA
jgi:glutaredoxin-like protein